MRIAPQPRRRRHVPADDRGVLAPRGALPRGGRSLELDLRGRAVRAGGPTELDRRRPSRRTRPRSSAPSRRTMRAGERVTQRVTLRLEGRLLRRRAVATQAETIVVRLLGRPAGRMPADRDERDGPSRSQARPTSGSRSPRDVGRRPRPRRRRRRGDPARGRARSWTRSATTCDRLAPVLADVPVARVLVHAPTGDTTPRAPGPRGPGAARGRDGRAPFVGGTASVFSELNRDPPERRRRRRVAFAISPEVHATDERSMMGDPRDPGARSSRKRVTSVGRLPVVVSPVLLAAHAGTPFADAWTIGCLAALAGAGSPRSRCDTVRSSARDRRANCTAASSLEVCGLRTRDRIAALAMRDASDPGVDHADRREPDAVTAAIPARANEAQPALGPYEVRTLCERRGLLVVVAHRGHVLEHPQPRGSPSPSGSRRRSAGAGRAPTARSPRSSRRAAARARASVGRTAAPRRPGSGSSRRRRRAGGTATPA